MARKGRILSEEELKDVDTFLQEKPSFSAVARAMKINRITIQKQYEKWKYMKIAAATSSVRLELAREEYRNHFNHLERMAEALVTFLWDAYIPCGEGESDNNKERPNEFPDDFWSSLLEEKEDKDEPFGRKKEIRVIRRGKQLFESLKKHSERKVHWELLEEWKRLWDASSDLNESMWKEALEEFHNFYKNRGKSFDSILDINDHPEQLLFIHRGLIRMVWQAVEQADPKSIARNILWHKDRPDFVVFQYHNYRCFPITLKLTEDAAKIVSNQVANKTREDPSAEFVTACNQIAKNLYISNKEEMTDKLHQFEKAVTKLDEELDPHRLRVIIANTNCDFCTP